eukprot:COSAG02_NODE_3403_length_6798_cov_63.887744_9_plen_120_part_00
MSFNSCTCHHSLNGARAGPCPFSALRSNICTISQSKPRELPHRATIFAHLLECTCHLLKMWLIAWAEDSMLFFSCHYAKLYATNYAGFRVIMPEFMLSNLRENACLQPMAAAQKGKRRR